MFPTSTHTHTYMCVCVCAQKMYLRTSSAEGLLVGKHCRTCLLVFLLIFSIPLSHTEDVVITESTGRRSVRPTSEISVLQHIVSSRRACPYSGRHTSQDKVLRVPAVGTMRNRSGDTAGPVTLLC